MESRKVNEQDPRQPYEQPEVLASYTKEEIDAAVIPQAQDAVGGCGACGGCGCGS